MCNKFLAALCGFTGIFFFSIQLLINIVINAAGDNTDGNSTVSHATSQRCSIVPESEDDPGEWDHCYDPKSTLGRWVHYDEARLKQSWWISVPGQDRCSYWIKWPNASWGVRQDWRVKNVENTSLHCCCSLKQERGVQPFSQILIILKFVLCALWIYIKT